MKIFKRISSLILCLIILFSSININSVEVFADASKRQATFLNFYQNSSGSLLDSKKLTVEDYYTLAVFMSNYYEPGVTKLSEMTSGADEGFLKNFVSALGHDMSDSFGIKMKEISMLISKDIEEAIESGVCTLIDNNNSIITGRQFMEKMIDTVKDENRFESGDSNRVYYKDNTGKHIAFDFSSPATRAALQTMTAFNPDLFLNSSGLESLDGLFIDHLGNLWGVEAGDRASSIKNSQNLKGMVSSLGADKIFLIMPACLNPSTFSKDVTDAKNLKMPLMNRYTLSCIMDSDSFIDNSTGHAKFTDYNIPFYSVIAQQYLGDFSKEAESGLTIFGVNSLSNNLLNVSQGGYNSNNAAYNLAQFLYNSDAVAIKKDTKNGIGQFSTNTYIVFSPNPDILSSVGGSGGQYKSGGNNNKNIDMATGCIKTDYFAFSALREGVGSSNEDETKGMKNQQKLVFYLFTPVALNLNQVSMSFYLSVGEGASSNTEEGASEAMAYSLYGSSTEDDLLAAKMGMRGFDLFFKHSSSSVELENSHGESEEYASMSPDNIYRSKIMERIFKATKVEYDVDVFNAIKNKKTNWMQDGYFDTSSYDYTRVKDVLSTLMEGKVSEQRINSFDLRHFVYYKKSDSEWLYGRGDVGDANDGGDSNNTKKVKIGNSGDYKDKTVYRWYIHPKSITTMGTSYDDVPDRAFGRTLGIGDSTIRGCLNGMKADITDATKANKGTYVTFTIGKDNDEENLVDYIIAYFCYEIFTPSSAVLDACTSTKAGNVGKKLLGNDSIEIKSQMNVSDFGNNAPFIMGVYFGYILDMHGINDISSEGMNFGEFDSVFLPNTPISAKGNQEYNSDDLDGDGLVSSEDLSFEEKQKDLINRIYGLTNDTNNDYRNNLIKNIIEGFILTVHRTITGTWYSNVDTVTTGSSNTYQSVTGYIYTPTLEELSFTATLMNNYAQLYIFCLMLILFFLIIMVLLNQRTWQQGMIIGFIMSIALLFPYILISNTINISNKVSDSIYSDRFDFWALSEHQQRNTSLVGAASLNDKDRLLTIGNATADLTNTGNAGVKIKWMSPKKVDMFQTLYSDKSLSESFVTNMEIFKWLFSSLTYDSEFVDTDAYGSYLYRPYNSIAIEAEAYYQWMSDLLESSDYMTNSNVDYNDGIISYNFNNVPSLFSNTLSKINSSSTSDSTFLAGLARIDKDYYINANGSRLSYSSDKLNDLQILGQKDSRSAYVIANQIGLTGCLSDDVTERFNDDILTATNFGIVSNLPNITENDYFEGKDARQISKALYLKNTESPYYYFYSVLKYRYTTNPGTVEFKKELINNDLFKISLDEEDALTSGKDVSGSFRDFLDLEGLFTYIVPYMKMSNDYVAEYQKINGSTVEEYNFDYKVDENTGDVTEIKNPDGDTNDYSKEVENKNNMNKVWNMYCPWVDSLYDLKVFNVKTKVGGNSVIITDTLNPSTYISNGRPMIFSEADMIEKGYKYSDLTDIERRIQAVTEKTYEDLMYLVNYYDMQDEVLISAAAMYATFNFNAEFSKDSFLGTSVMLYPQGFELKNFNYDAFMRLALLNSTGESVFATEDLYSRVLAKTSLFTGLLLLICDLVACILIPMIKFIIVLGLLFLGVLICLTCVINPPEKIFESISKSLLLPTVLFMALNIAFSWGMSLIVGEGLTAYVGSKGVNFATNDPTITMLIMAIVGCVYVFCGFKILKFLWSAYKQFGMSTALAAVGIVGAAFAAGTTGLAKKATKALGRGVGAGVGMATAGKGNRLAGAFEGARAGTRGVIDRRIQEKRMARMMGGGLPSGEGKSSSSTTNKINSLAKGKGSGGSSTVKKPATPIGKSDSSVPTSELKRKMTNDTNKNSTKLAKMLSGASYAGAVIGDKARAVGTGFKKVGMVLSHPVASGTYAAETIKDKAKAGFNKVGDKIGSGVQKAKNYTKKSLEEYKYERGYNKLRNQERQGERNKSVDSLKNKIAAGAVTHAVKKGAKAVAKRSIGL